jgi:hypothetical protein
MYSTLILSTSATVTPTVSVHMNDDDAVDYAESIVSAGESTVYWYTVLDTVTGEQTHNGLLNETALV